MSQVVIGDILPYTQATAVGGQTVFGTNWTANYASDVVVYLTPSGDSPNDVLQQLSYPSDFSVDFIGALQQVQVTLVSAASSGDIVTVTRQTPADRENLYTNTNFVPSMLNNDFGILTLVDQQAQLVDQKIGPRYNYSAVIVDVVDTILPILGANQIWVKNNANTGIIPLTVPTSGFAPSGATYITLTNDLAELPNSLPLTSVGSGIMISKTSTNTVLARAVTGTANQVAVLNGDGLAGDINIAIAQNPVIPGTAGMGIPQGTTGQRAIPLSGISFRYNTTNAQLEYWDGAVWAGLTDNGLTHNYIFVGDSTGTADEVPMSGDATIIDTGAVTVSKIGGVPISLAGGFTTHGAYTADFTFTGSTNVTFPTTGTLATTTTSTVTLTGNTGVATVNAGNINVVGGSTGLTFTGATDTLTLGGLLNSTYGGTGISAPTAHGIMVGEGASPMTPIVLSSGQILIGSTGADPVAAAINSGTGILVGNGAGSITISLAAIASHDILSNITAGSAAPIANTLTATIDAAIGSTQGNILYRNASAWTVLAPGTSGQFLTTGGAAANVSWTSQVAPTGAALTEVNDTNVTLTLGGSPTTALLAATSLTLGWTGTLAATRGGTGTGTYTLGDTLYSSAANTLSKLAGNTTIVKQYLSQTGDGVNSAAPSWATVAGGDITGAALSKTDDTNVTMTLGGAPTTALLRAASMTLGWTGQLALTRGGTAASLTASNGGIVYSTASTLAILSGTATAGQILQSGASTTPAWSTSTYPATNAINTLLYASSANVMAALATANNGVLITSAGGVPSISSTLPSGLAMQTPASLVLTNATGLPVAGGGTGNTTFTAYSVITAGTTATGAFQNVSGLGSSGQVLTSNGAGALPTWQSTGAPALPVSLANGGTNASLTASNGGIFYSTASAGAILAGTATAGLALLSGASTTPKWSSSPPITQVNVQRITASGAGTYTPTSGMVYVIVRAQAGGAAGGGAATTGAAASASGGGGGGGEYIEAIFTAANIGASKAYSLGAKGSGVAGNNPGGNGSNTTFNTTWIVTTGGTGGTGAASTSLAAVSAGSGGGSGGTGGSVATGTLIRQLPGGCGNNSMYLINAGIPGFGGNSGSGAGLTNVSITSSNAGVAAAANSGGGGSGANTLNGSQQAGGAGGDGFIEFIEFISI